MADVLDARVQVLLAEYEFVTGLIKYYRDVELRALFGTGLVLTAVAAAVAAIESTDAPAGPNRGAEALLLAIAALVPSVLLIIVIMAKSRGMRAVVYVRDGLRPLARELTGHQGLLEWETRASDLTKTFLDKAVAGHWYAHVPMRGAFIGFMLRGTPIILAIGGSSIALGAAGIAVACGVHGSPRDETLVAIVIGGLAAAVTVVFATGGILFTNWTDTPRPRRTKRRRES